MKAPPIYPDEPARLAALHALGILDTATEERFDRIARLAQHILHTPIALISLVDSERQWFKSRVGLEQSETSREVSFCAHALHQASPLVIEDTLADERFRDNPLVLDDPHIRFYAGHPLRSPDGYGLGTLCIIDREPRTIGAGDLQALRDLAALVEGELRAVEHRVALELLAKEEVRFQTLAEACPVGIFQSDASGRCLYTNARWQEITGLSASEALGDGWAKALHPEDASKVFEEWKAAAIWGNEFARIFRFKRPSGEIRWVRARAGALRDSNGKITNWVGTDEDITAYRQLESSLRDSEELFRQVAEHTELIFWVMDLATREVLYVSPAYNRLRGRPGEELYSDPLRWLDGVHPDDRERVRSIFETSIKARMGFEYEYRVQHPEGRTRTLHTSAFTVNDTSGTPYRLVGIVTDVTKQKFSENVLRELATTDSLSSLANSRHFVERLELELARARRNGSVLSVAMIDLDNFKQINDGEGHDAGDQVIRTVAKVIQRRVRATDLAGRYGGDELCVLLPDTPLPAAIDLLEHLRHLIQDAEIPLPNGHTVRVTVSIGVAQTTAADESSTLLLKAADAALYRAKRAGRNNTQCAPLVSGEFSSV